MRVPNEYVTFNVAFSFDYIDQWYGDINGY
jgi:hypothetical protein